MTAGALSLDGGVVTAGFDSGGLAAWDLATGELLEIGPGHSARVNVCGFLTGGTLGVTGAADRTVKVWDLETGAERVAFRGHRAEPVGGPQDPRKPWKAAVTAWAIDPAGEWIVSVPPTNRRTRNRSRNVDSREQATCSSPWTRPSG